MRTVLMQMGFEEMPTNQSPDAAAMNRRFWICGNVWFVLRRLRHPPTTRVLLGNEHIFFLGAQKNWMMFGGIFLLKDGKHGQQSSKSPTVNMMKPVSSRSSTLGLTEVGRKLILELWCVIPATAVAWLQGRIPRKSTQKRQLEAENAMLAGGFKYS